MSSRKFKFISPGVFLNEIDNSQLPNEPRDMGPLVIGRAKKGPAMRPVIVDSFAEFVQLYGEPVPGGNGSDIWRNGNETTPMYGTYASQAWLKNSSTLTYLRLLGTKDVDAGAAGNAGWKLDGTIDSGLNMTMRPHFPTDTTTGSAYGLFVITNEASGNDGTKGFPEIPTVTGSLVATWYVQDGVVGLVGQFPDWGGSAGANTYTTAQTAGSGSARFIGSDAQGNFTVVITGSNSSGYPNRVQTFSLSPTNKNYIRNVFNTNPTLTNVTTAVSASRERYWLGETYAYNFAQKVARNVVTGTGGPASGSVGGVGGELESLYIGFILPLISGSGATIARHGSRQTAFEDSTGRNNPRTGWFFGQDLGGGNASGSYSYYNMNKIFKLHALDHAEWASANLKISISNLNYSTNEFNKYGRFDVLVRQASDTDQAPIVLERFSNCNLNPNSLDHVAKKIGDQYVSFNTTTRRLETKGDYPNKSKYVRIEMAFEDPPNEELLPFGVYGPLQYNNIDFANASNAIAAGFGSTMAYGARQFLSQSTAGLQDVATDQLIITGSGTGAVVGATLYKFLFPSHELRMSASQDGISDPTDAYWGVWTGKSSSNNKFNPDYADLNRNLSDNEDQFDTGTNTTYQFVFTLDEIVQSGSTNNFYWLSGSRSSNDANVTNRLPISAKTGSASYRDVIDAGINRFTSPLYGGSDGLDITEKDPFRNTLLADATATTSYAYNSIKEAVDIVRDPEFVEYNLVSIPGITNEQLTSHLIDTCELRADALAVIDLKGDFAPAHEGTSKTYPNLSTTISNLKDRGINSSYGCAFYPFVQIRDTIAGNLVYMPSSVAAIGAMSYTDRVRAPWFAPAGFNRGGLSSGVAGLPVINVTQKLTSKDRDDLYDANINPIASFPNEGIVIFGQKTLQVTRSALDRINVRRLLLFIKKGISNIAANILFEPNVRSTWARFIGQAEPFLADVKARFGLDDYKLVLDETTTTPDLIDRNILYAKVYLKPTRAIEFVAVDFIISNTGASFED